MAILYNRAFHRVVPIFFALSLLLLQAGLNIRLRTLEVAWVAPVPRGDETRRKWDPNLYRILSFGHLPAAVDWLLIEILADTALTRFPAGIHPGIYYGLDLLTDLDPAFFEAYYAGANLLAVIRDDGLGARDLLLKGVRFRKTGLQGFPPSFRDSYWGGAWSLSVLLAYVHLFELKDMPRAALAFEEAAMLPNAPEYVRKLAKRFGAKGGEYEVGLRLLDFMIAQAKEDAELERLESQKKSLRIARYLFEVKEDFARFRAALAPGTDIGKAWRSFVAQRPGGQTDPWGGVLSLGGEADGKIVSSTPYEKVFGME